MSHDPFLPKSAWIMLAAIAIVAGAILTLAAFSPNPSRRAEHEVRLQDYDEMIETARSDPSMRADIRTAMGDHVMTEAEERDINSNYVARHAANDMEEARRALQHAAAGEDSGQ